MSNCIVESTSGSLSLSLSVGETRGALCSVKCDRLVPSFMCLQRRSHAMPPRLENQTVVFSAKRSVGERRTTTLRRSSSARRQFRRAPLPANSALLHFGLVAPAVQSRYVLSIKDIERRGLSNNNASSKEIRAGLTSDSPSEGRFF